MRFSDVFTGLGRPVVYYPSLNAITGSVAATVFLANLFQWSGTQRDPDGWIYKTQEEIEAETGLSRREQETARKQLRAATLLREERRGVPARLYYLIHVETLNGAWEEFLANKNGGIRQTIRTGITIQGRHRIKKPSLPQMCGMNSQRWTSRTSRRTFGSPGGGHSMTQRRRSRSRERNAQGKGKYHRER